MSDTSPTPIGDRRRALLDLYDGSMPEVSGHPVVRYRSTALAADLTSETFLAATDAAEREAVPDLTIAGLIGVTRPRCRTR